MVFACQKNSFLKTFSTTVKSCEKVTDNSEEWFEVTCEDTILFPEGGGQPNDTGFLDDVAVFNVQRRGPEAVHYVKTPLQIGKQVTQVLDWERRLDHMQQHSGQHLVTAIINAEYKIDTTSWWLGVDVCHIELDVKSLTAEQIERIEILANKKIQEQVPVRVKMCNPGDAALEGARTRGLPDDVAGPIRIVEIVGMEDDLCCGTHVENLVQLQAIKLLYPEKGKKNKTNLFFISGSRVLKYLGKTLEREQKLTKILNNDPDQHVDLVEKLQFNVKITAKKLSNVLKKCAADQAQAFLATNPRPEYYLNHCKEGDQEFIDAFLRAIKDDPEVEKTLFLLIVGDGSGIITLYGSKEPMAEIGPRIAEMLGGKGILHNGKFQAKVPKLGKIQAIEKLVKDSVKVRQ